MYLPFEKLAELGDTVDVCIIVAGPPAYRLA